MPSGWTQAQMLTYQESVKRWLLKPLLAVTPKHTCIYWTIFFVIWRYWGHMRNFLLSTIKTPWLLWWMGKITFCWRRAENNMTCHLKNQTVMSHFTNKLLSWFKKGKNSYNLQVFFIHHQIDQLYLCLIWHYLINVEYPRKVFVENLNELVLIHLNIILGLWKPEIFKAYMCTYLGW